MGAGVSKGYESDHVIAHRLLRTLNTGWGGMHLGRVGGVPGAGRTPVSTANLAPLLLDICHHYPLPESDLFHGNRINDSMPGPSASHLGLPLATVDIKTRKTNKFCVTK